MAFDWCLSRFNIGMLSAALEFVKDPVALGAHHINGGIAKANPNLPADSQPDSGLEFLPLVPRLCLDTGICLAGSACVGRKSGNLPGRALRAHLEWDDATNPGLARRASPSWATFCPRSAATDNDAANPGLARKASRRPGLHSAAASRLQRMMPRTQGLLAKPRGALGYNRPPLRGYRK